MLTPKKLRNWVRKRLGKKYSIGSIRRLMRLFKMSPKTASFHLAHAADVETVKKWQRTTFRKISRLKERGFAILIQDESMFVDESKSGRKYWSPKGMSILVTKPGRHRKTAVVYGSISDDGEQLFELGDRFNAKNFVRHLESIRIRWKKAMIILDNAKQHSAKLVRKYLEEHKDDIILHYLPVGTPQLSAIEECWRQAKRELLMSESYHSYQDMRHFTSRYFQTRKFGMDIYPYLKRSV